MKQGVDYVGISVVYFCHDGKGNVVLAKRGKNSRDEQGKWDIGAGAVEFGISVEDTLRKEIKEEYCTDVLSFEFLGYRDIQRIHNGKQTHWVGLDFNVLINSKKVKNGEPHKLDEVSMFPIHKYPKPAHSQFPKFLALYKGRLG